jgi:hypothetical protein
MCDFPDFQMFAFQNASTCGGYATSPATYVRVNSLSLATKCKMHKSAATYILKAGGGGAAQAESSWTHSAKTTRFLNPCKPEMCFLGFTIDCFLKVQLV